MAVARQRIDPAIEQRVADLPDRRGHESSDGDGGERGQQAAADLAAIEPDDGVHAPDLEYGDDADEGDDAGNDPPQQRQGAVGATFQPRKTLQDLRRYREA